MKLSKIFFRRFYFYLFNIFYPVLLVLSLWILTLFPSWLAIPIILLYIVYTIAPPIFLKRGDKLVDTFLSALSIVFPIWILTFFPLWIIVFITLLFIAYIILAPYLINRVKSIQDKNKNNSLKSVQIYTALYQVELNQHRGKWNPLRNLSRPYVGYILGGKSIQQVLEQIEHDSDVSTELSWFLVDLLDNSAPDKLNDVLALNLACSTARNTNAKPDLRIRAAHAIGNRGWQEEEEMAAILVQICTDTETKNSSRIKCLAILIKWKRIDQVISVLEKLALDEQVPFTSRTWATEVCKFLSDQELALQSLSKILRVKQPYHRLLKIENNQVFTRISIKALEKLALNEQVPFRRRLWAIESIANLALFSASNGSGSVKCF